MLNSRALFRELVEHDHTERFHQGIGGELIKSQLLAAGPLGEKLG